MSLNPFQADPAVARRLADHPADRIGALARAVPPLIHDGILTAADAAGLVKRFDLAGTSDLMLLLLTHARTYARPPISRFQVGAIGLEDPTGDLIFGHNVEFPGTHLGTTLHGEGFVATRAFGRGTRITVLALGEAHPCAHCRQFLSEFAGSAALVLIDPLGHRLTLSQLYPWPFDPAYLGETGAVAGKVQWPNLTPEHADMDSALLDAGRRAHAPYSQCPAAVQLTMTDGFTALGAVIESVAFNPTMGPLQAALVDFLAHGYDYQDIRSASLAQVNGGNVNYAPSTAELLKQIAPHVTLTVQRWAV